MTRGTRSSARPPVKRLAAALTATRDTAPGICSECGADEMGCQVKRGLSGRRCCGDDCTHQDAS
jgi:hypothetical protein